MILYNKYRLFILDIKGIIRNLKLDYLIRKVKKLQRNWTDSNTKEKEQESE